MTPQSLIDLAVESGHIIDARFPGLRTFNSDEWMEKVAYLASRTDPRVGRKSRGPGARVSPDTVGIKQNTMNGDTDPFYAVSIIRDNPPINEWRPVPNDYGLIQGQLWIESKPSDIGGPVEPPEPPSNLEARVTAIENWIKSFR